LSPATDKGDATRIFAAFALLLAAVCTPLFSTVLPPLADYPNHLARIQLIAGGGSEFYAVRWAALPDLAADLVVSALAWAMPLELAAKLFLVLNFALIAGGTLWLNRVASGSWRWWPLLAFALLYNRSFLWGFINYLFGLGVALCGLALWLSLDEWRWLRVPVSAAVALACFFCHLAAFGIYALAIAGVELPPVLELLRARRHGMAATRIALLGVQFVAPAIVFLGFTPHAAGGPVSFAFWRKFDLLFSVFDNYSRSFDIVCFILFVALIGGLAWRRHLTIAPRLGLAAAIVAAAYVLLPNQALSGSSADHRIPLALFLLLVAASWPVILRKRAAIAIAVTAAALFAARMTVIEAVWLKSDAVYAADIAAIDGLPHGTKLAVAFPVREIAAGGIPQLHVAALAAARRGAFVPTVFAYAAQQPLARRPPYDALAAASIPASFWAAFVDNDAAAQAQAAPLLKNYDFIVFASRDPFTVPARPCLEKRPSPANFQLFALRHDGECR
jgi:hypothetical protein